jgi:hypothetical protein
MYGRILGKKEVGTFLSLICLPKAELSEQIKIRCILPSDTFPIFLDKARAARVDGDYRSMHFGLWHENEKERRGGEAISLGSSGQRAMKEIPGFHCARNEQFMMDLGFEWPDFTLP